MFDQFKFYILGGLMLALVAVSGSFAVYHRVATAEADALKAKNAVIELVVKEQSRTIDQMIKDAQKLADANRELAKSIMKTEMENAAEQAAIEALDLSFGDTAESAAELERKVNSEFESSLSALRKSTGNLPVGDVVRDK